MAGQRHASSGGGKRIVIVGGGPTAVAALTHLGSVSGIDEVTIASWNEIGLTQPFSPGDTRFICNTSLDVTSLDPDGPSDLLRYLAGRGWPVHRDDFIPRYLVGSYARERYLAARDSMSRAGVRVRHQRDEVRSVVGEPGAYRLALASGRVLSAGDVLLCTGSGSPFVPPVLQEHVESIGVTVLPASPAELRAVPAGARVLLLGSKLSAVDTALILCPRGCQVVMASPSGQLPAVRTRLTRQPAHGFAVQWQDRAGWATETDIRRTARELLRAARAGADGPSGLIPGRHLHALARLRTETERAAAGKVPWQDVIAEVIDAMNTVLPHWPAPDRQRILALHRKAVSRYVSAIPERNARLLLHYADAGLLSLAGLCPERIDQEPGGGWRVKWQDGSASRFDHVVSAAGHRRPTHTVTASGELRLDRGSHRTGLPYGSAPTSGWNAAPTVHPSAFGHLVPRPVLCSPSLITCEPRHNMPIMWLANWQRRTQRDLTRRPGLHRSGTRPGVSRGRSRLRPCLRRRAEGSVRRRSGSAPGLASRSGRHGTGTAETGCPDDHGSQRVRCDAGGRACGTARSAAPRPGLAAARRDKELMMRALRAAGVSCPDSKSVSTAAALAGFLDGAPAYPLVVKPRNSAGTDGCTVCPDRATAEAAFTRVIGERNLIGEVNESVLVQEFLAGNQYVVNTVSMAGRHLLTEVYGERIDRIDGVPVLRHMLSLRALSPANRRW